MSPRPFVNDALWRCLCPRWMQVSVRAEAGFIGATKRASSYAARRNCILSTLPTINRSYTTAATAPSDTPSSAYPLARPDRNAPTRGRTPDRSSKDQAPLVHLSNEELYHRLRVHGPAGMHEEVMSILKILIKDRREPPNLPMYTALLHSYVSPQMGTAGKVRKTLEDMEWAGVELDVRACECVLEALAVHPDSFLRTDILEYMKARWWDLSPRAQGWVVAGLLRERCFEMALERLEGMVQERVKIGDWLWDKAIWMLLEFGEVEEAFYVLSLKQSVAGNEDVKLSGALWTQLLDVAGKRHIVEAASMIWNMQVVPGHLKPTTGTCLNILSVASRVGDVWLATDVFRVLADRDTVFSAHHYETLIQCYLTANDLPAALNVVLIMHDASLKVSEDGLHPLYAYLRQDKDLLMDAFMQLQDLERSGRKVPTAAVNVCIKAAVKQDDLPTAIELYKALGSVASAGPNTATFNELLAGCHSTGRKELAMYLASEMIEMKINPDRITYDRLILTCMNAGDMDDAISYFEEMRLEGLAPRRRTHEQLVERALENNDGRCVAMLKMYAEAEYCVETRLASMSRKVYRQFEEGGERKARVEEESLEAAGNAEPTDGHVRGVTSSPDEGLQRLHAAEAGSISTANARISPSPAVEPHAQPKSP